MKEKKAHISFSVEELLDLIMVISAALEDDVNSFEDEDGVERAEKLINKIRKHYRKITANAEKKC